MSTCSNLIRCILNENQNNISKNDYDNLLKLIDICKFNIELKLLQESYNNYFLKKENNLVKKLDLIINELENLIDIKYIQLKELPYGIINKDDNNLILLYKQLIDNINDLKLEIKNSGQKFVEDEFNQLKKNEFELINTSIKVFEQNDLELMNFFEQNLLTLEFDNKIINESLIEQIYLLLENQTCLNKFKIYSDKKIIKENLIKEKNLINTMLKYQDFIKEFVSLINLREKNKKVLKFKEDDLKILNSNYFQENKIIMIWRLISKRQNYEYKMNLELLNKKIYDIKEELNLLEIEINSILSNTKLESLKEILNIYCDNLCETDGFGFFYERDFSHLVSKYNKEFIEIISYFNINNSFKNFGSKKVTVDDLNNRLKVIEDELSKITFNEFKSEEINYFIKEKETLNNILKLENENNEYNPLIYIYILKFIFEVKKMNKLDILSLLSELTNQDYKDINEYNLQNFEEKFKILIDELNKKVDYCFELVDSKLKIKKVSIL